jgi:hypothetical protein
MGQGFIGRSDMTNLQPWIPKWEAERTEEERELARQIEPVLRERARTRRSNPLITYKTLGKRLGRYYRDPVMMSALGLVSINSLKQNGYALSALVVTEETGMPGEGFWGVVGPDSHPDEFKKLELFSEQIRLITGRG